MLPPDITDLASRFGALVRQLQPQIEHGATAAASCSDSSMAAAIDVQGYLARLLEEILRALPSVDAHHHRYRLVRDLREKLRSALHDVLEQAATEVWDETTLSEHCLAHPEFHRCLTALQSELEAMSSSGNGGALASQLREALERDPDDSGNSESSGADDEHDLMLQEELDADLPPFLELPSMLSAAREAGGDGLRAREAWTKLQAFSASDLLESDQWPQVPAALLAILRADDRLGEEERTACAALHISLFEEGGPAERAAIARSLWHVVTERTASSGRVEGQYGAFSVCLQLMSRARFELCNDAIHMRDDELADLLRMLAGLTRGTQGAPLDTSLHLAALDPSARWAARLFSRARLQALAWHVVVESGVLEAADESLDVALLSPSAFSSSSDPAGNAMIPVDSEMRVALQLHHTCFIAICLRQATAGHRRNDGGSAEYAQKYATPWASSTLPKVIRRLADIVSLATCSALSPYARASTQLAIDALSASLAALVHAQCTHDLWSEAAVAASIAPLDALFGRSPSTPDSDVARMDTHEHGLHGAVQVASRYLPDGSTCDDAVRRNVIHLMSAATLMPAVQHLARDAPEILVTSPRYSLVWARAALALVGTPGSSVAHELGLRCLVVLAVLLRTNRDAAKPLIPFLLSATRRAGWVNDLRAETQTQLLVAAGAIARVFCGAIGCCSMLPPEALTPLIKLLSPTTSENNLQQDDEPRAIHCVFDVAARDVETNVRLHASVLAGTAHGSAHQGTVSLALSRARIFVSMAESGFDTSAHTLHGGLLPGAAAPLLESLCALTSLIAWPHAIAAAFDHADETGVAAAGERMGSYEHPIAQLLLRDSTHYEESRAAGLLLVNLLSVDVHTASRLQRRFALMDALRPDPADEESGVAIIDLNSVCRARLFATVEELGTPSEWSASRREMARHAAHPFERLAAQRKATAKGEGSKGADQPEVAGDGFQDAVRSSPSARVQVAARVLCCRAAEGSMRSIWAAVLRHAHGNRVSLEADLMDRVSASARSDAVTEMQHEGGEFELGRLWAAKMLEYAARAGATGRDRTVASAHVAALAELACCTGAAIASAVPRVEPAMAVLCILLDDAEEAASFARSIRQHAVAPHLFTAAALASPPRGEAVLRFVEDLIARELPDLDAALQRAALPAALPVARWLSAGWVNFLPWNALVCATLVPLLLGIDMQAYLAIAALKHVADEAACACAHPAELHMALMLPLEGFDPVAAIPDMLDMQRRHRERCLAALAEACA